LTNPALILVSSLQQFLYQLLGFVPKLIVALAIWIIGKWIVVWAVNLLKKVELKGAKPVNKLVQQLAYILLPFGKVILFLVVLDYLGIGRTVISALLSGLTFAIAITLGLAFGKALEDDAKAVVDSIKRQLEK
jgi:small conductance mechanosensitive channel